MEEYSFLARAGLCVCSYILYRVFNEIAIARNGDPDKNQTFTCIIALFSYLVLFAGGIILYPIFKILDEFPITRAQNEIKDKWRKSDDLLREDFQRKLKSEYVPIKEYRSLLRDYDNQVKINDVHKDFYERTIDDQKRVLLKIDPYLAQHCWCHDDIDEYLQTHYGK